MQEVEAPIRRPARTASATGSSSSRAKGKLRARHDRRGHALTQKASTPPKRSLLQAVLEFVQMVLVSVWRILRHIRLLSVLLTPLQSVLLRGFALLQYANDFPLRMQFRRTTRRFLSVMNTTEDYATFADAAASLDHYCGVAQWAQEAPPLAKCDAVGLLVDATAAQQLIQTSNTAGMEVFLCSLLKRNAHGLMDPSVYNYFNCAKYCIEDYTQAMQDLITAYAATNTLDNMSIEKGASTKETNVKDTLPLHSLRTCWFRTDALQEPSSEKTSSFSFSLPWESSTSAQATAAAAAAAATAAPASLEPILPAVDITTRIQHTWRRTASEHALLSASLTSRQANGSPCIASPLSGAAAKAAHPPNVVGGTPCVAKGSSGQLLGSASAGEESNYLTEDEAPSASASSAVDPPLTSSEARLPNEKKNRLLPSSLSTAKSQTMSLGALHTSAQAVHAEYSLFAHIEASCTALHRFMDCCTSASPRAPSRPQTRHRTRVLRQVLHSFGRTALVLSGGSSMGTYHAGVARALYEANVMPDILCGSSAGSIIATFIATKTPTELRSFMRSDVLSTEAMQMSPFGEDANLAEKLHRFFKTGFLMDVRTLMECMRGQCGDLTFLEAYELSGKVLNVSVTRSQHEGTHADRHALLNYVTAPDVVIWSAVSASCALPGLFTAVQLIEKPPSAGGTFAPYLPGELWCDGSVAQDIPRRLLTQLFGVDYFIVSQVNPYVIPFLKHPRSHLVVSSGPSVCSRLWFALVAVWVWLFTVLFSLRLLPRRGACEVLFLAFAQDYGGDITIYPVESLLTAAPDYLNLVNNPSAEYISYVASRAQCRTWPLVTRIRLATTIERSLVQELRRLEMLQLSEDAKA